LVCGILGYWLGEAVNDGSSSSPECVLFTFLGPITLVIAIAYTIKIALSKRKI